ncbi:amino acid permease [Bacillus sp. PS06]|uniref:amino acid permease n=1 Tax=Bacillus sp. PS06 TaxID=2764176 RepID=UPI0017858F69|nr:amino acid permease [Bacillus sp. PS06]MBD8071503.1 amino acid permease [Bacillus sp. PS06]
MKEKKSQNQSKGSMKWWQLSLFGVGCTIGTGFFLGSSIAITKSGPAVLLLFILAAIGTYFVFDALAKMTASDPQKGAFRTYAKKAFGHWAGFSIGWVYWASEMLIMGSQLTALSIFSQFWFPSVPLWIFACVYAVLGIIVLLIGIKWLNRIEGFLAVIKIAAILMFIIIAGAGLLGAFGGSTDVNMPTTMSEFFPRPFLGLWSALIFAFYAFGGIEIMGLMATQLKNPNEAPKAGKIMILLLTIIYVASIGLAVIMVSWDSFNTEKSPFVTALKNYDLPFIPHLFNSALIIAGFSTMAAALFGVTSILVNLSEDGDAPRFFSKKGKLKIPLPALGLTTAGLVTSIVLSLLMPDSIYEYITTGAGLMLLYNWAFILMSANRNLKPGFLDRMKYYTGLLLILLAVTGTILTKESRPGFFISLGFIVIIGSIAWKMNSKWKKDDNNTKSTSLFKKLEKS